MDVETLRELVCLHARKHELEAELRTVVAQISKLDGVVLRQFISDGVRSMAIDGRTVYIATSIEANPVEDRASVIAALKQSGLGQYVTENYSTQSLRAFVREVADEVEARCDQTGELFTEDGVRSQLPPSLAETLVISFVHSLRSRKS